MRAEFMSQIEEDLHFWITLSTCHTQVDFVMGVEQEEPRIFVAVTIDNAIEAEKVCMHHSFIPSPYPLPLTPFPHSLSEGMMFFASTRPSREAT